MVYVRLWNRLTLCTANFKIYTALSEKEYRVSDPISTFMRLWVIYIFPQSVCLFCWRKYVDRSWDYINRSQTHECGNWGWGRAIPRKGINKWDFCCSVSRTVWDWVYINQPPFNRESTSTTCPMRLFAFFCFHGKDNYLASTSAPRAPRLFPELNCVCSLAKRHGRERDFHIWRLQYKANYIYCQH